MSKSDTFENDFLKLTFNGTPIAGIADNAASGALANFYVAAHTADPADAGGQTTSEVAYTGYARKAVVRTSSGWTVSGSTVSLVADATWGSCTASPPANPITHWSVGKVSSGAGTILYSGPLDSPITVGVGDEPMLGAGSTITED